MIFLAGFVANMRGLCESKDIPFVCTMRMVLIAKNRCLEKKWWYLSQMFGSIFKIRRLLIMRFAR